MFFSVLWIFYIPSFSFQLFITPFLIFLITEVPLIDVLAACRYIHLLDSSYSTLEWPWRFLRSSDLPMLHCLEFGLGGSPTSFNIPRFYRWRNWCFFGKCFAILALSIVECTPEFEFQLTKDHEFLGSLDCIDTGLLLVYSSSFQPVVREQSPLHFLGLARTWRCEISDSFNGLTVLGNLRLSLGTCPSKNSHRLESSTGWGKIFSVYQLCSRHSTPEQQTITIYRKTTKRCCSVVWT